MVDRENNNENNKVRRLSYNTLNRALPPCPQGDDRQQRTYSADVSRLDRFFGRPLHALAEKNIRSRQLRNDLIHRMSFLTHLKESSPGLRPEKILSLQLDQF